MPSRSAAICVLPTSAVRSPSGRSQSPSVSSSTASGILFQVAPWLNM